MFIAAYRLLLLPVPPPWLRRSLPVSRTKTNLEKENAKRTPSPTPTDRLFLRPTGRPTDRLLVRPTNCLHGRPINCSSDRLTVPPTDRPTGCSSDRTTDCSPDCPIDGSSDRRTVRPTDTRMVRRSSYRSHLTVPQTRLSHTEACIRTRIPTDRHAEKQTGSYCSYCRTRSTRGPGGRSLSPHPPHSPASQARAQQS